MSARLTRLREAINRMQVAWSIVGVTMLTILIFELVLRGFFAIKDAHDPARARQEQLLCEAEGDPVWPRVHARELAQLQDRWAPWVLFRQSAFRGETISIDERGMRRTWRTMPGKMPTTKPPLVLLLGGSALWGYGARDAHTIPSLLVQRLSAQDRPVDMRNQAQIGYVATQELILLCQELENGLRPNVVVFLDGVNDATAAFLDGQAGVSTNESNRRYEFNLRRSAPRLAQALVRRVLDDSALARLARSIAQRLGREQPSRRLDQAGPVDSELVEQVVLHYAQTANLVRVLGQHYGFQPVFFWQPVVFTKKTKSQLEQLEAAKYAALEPFFRAVNDRVGLLPSLAASRDFHNLSSLFNDESAPVFIDYCHTTEQANEKLADAMAGPIRNALDRSLAKPQPEPMPEPAPPP